MYENWTKEQIIEFITNILNEHRTDTPEILRKLNRNTNIHREFVVRELARINDKSSLKQVSSSVNTLIRYLDFDKSKLHKFEHIKTNMGNVVFETIEIKKLQLSSLEGCLLNCNEYLLNNAIAKLKLFVLPNEILYKKPFSDFELDCIQLMLHCIFTDLEIMKADE